MPFVSADSDAVRVRVQVQPRSSRPRVAGMRDGCLRVHVAAPPVEGAANHAVIALLAKWLALPKSSISVVRGAASRSKTIAIAASDPGALAGEIRRRAAAESDV